MHVLNVVSTTTSSGFTCIFSANSIMSAIHSSVRPKDSNLPWGTILKPEFGLGYQKMTEYEIDQAVTRLHRLPEAKHRMYPRAGPKMEQQEINDMVS